MELDVHADWGRICDYVDKAMKAGIYVSLATVDADGMPTVMPIGSLVLDTSEPTGFFLEKFPKSIAANASHNPNFCILAEDTKLSHIIKELRGRGGGLLGVKLFGTFGPRRAASAEEKARIKARLPLGKFVNLDKVLFAEGGEIRELTFSRAEAMSISVDEKAGTYQLG
ncbi:MAG: hypothetical protein LBR39_00465 [Coriobacteriales bacterium]|jgi:hypothetical protein|nr:hypothetical protein [Coriobacteriales bacterium]